MQAAFVLHRWPYQETSLLVEFFTAEQGRFRAIAKGAKRPKSPWRAILQPFIPLQIETRGRHELQTLTQAEASAVAIPLQGVQLYSAFYVSELIQRCTSSYQAADELFHAYQETLYQLSQQQQVEAALRRFEWQLLMHSGHAFDWQHCANTGAVIRADKQYQFVPEHGFIEHLNGNLAGVDILTCAAIEDGASGHLPLLKRIMRQALRPYLGEQPLRSRALFKKGS